MASYHGRGGAVTWGTLTHLDTKDYNWSIDYTADAEEVTAFGIAKPWPRSNLPGLTSWTGSYECRLDSTNYAKNSDIGWMNIINLDTGNIHYKGSAFITSWSVTEAVDGIPTATAAFQGSGTLTISDA